MLYPARLFDTPYYRIYRTFMQQLSDGISGVMGHWWLFAVLLAVATVLYAYGIPRAKAPVFAGNAVAPKLLDEYLPTWRAAQAPVLLEGIGPQGRDALQRFYLRMDLWFPGPAICLAYAALLSLAFPPGAPLSWLNLLAIPALAFDVAENVNHLIMARRYPDTPRLSLRLGPSFTLFKWVLAMTLPVIAAVGLAARYL